MSNALTRPRSADSARAVAAQLFHALSDETRLGVLEMLRGGERCVCDLQGVLDAAQSRLSFHLKVLKDAGLVTDRKDGRWSYYAINAERFAEAEAILSELTTPAGSPTARERLTLHPLERAGATPAAAGAKSGRRSARPQRAIKARSDGCCG